jgi:hypothetical protein
VQTVSSLLRVKYLIRWLLDMIEMDYERVSTVERIITSENTAAHYLCCHLLLQNAPVWYFVADPQTAEDRTENDDT